MKYLYNIKIYLAFLALCSCIVIDSKAQKVIEIEPLFEYPVAPEELESIVDKSEYLVQHFWDQLDFKSTAPLNQIALNDAFRVFVTPLRFAPEKVSMKALENIINNISNNPTLLVQFIKAAEEALYGPRAEVWSDELYLRFLDAGIKSKKVTNSRKEKYKTRAELLRSNSVGGAPPTFSFTDADDKQEKYFPMSTLTVIIFGDPEDTDWRLSRLKFDTNSELTQALEKGKINIIYIVAKEGRDWKDAVSNYSKYWKTGISDEIWSKYDIRAIPSAYLIGSDGKIVMKNTPVGSALRNALELVK